MQVTVLALEKFHVYFSIDGTCLSVMSYMNHEVIKQFRVRSDKVRKRRNVREWAKGIHFQRS